MKMFKDVLWLLPELVSVMTKAIPTTGCLLECFLSLDSRPVYNPLYAFLGTFCITRASNMSWPEWLIKTQPPCIFTCYHKGWSFLIQTEYKNKICYLCLCFRQYLFLKMWLSYPDCLHWSTSKPELSLNRCDFTENAMWMGILLSQQRFPRTFSFILLVPCVNVAVVGLLYLTN